MTQLSEGKQVLEVAPNSITFTLPISHKEVVLTVPTWGRTKAINREAKTLKLEGNEATGLIICRTATFDGKTLMQETELDDFDMRDINKLLTEYSNLVGGQEDEKNA